MILLNEKIQKILELKILLTTALMFCSLSSATFAAEEDEDRFLLSGVPRMIETGGIPVSDIKAVNNYMRSLIEEFEGKPENPTARCSDHLDIRLRDTQNVCRASSNDDGVQILNCTVRYRSQAWNGIMKAKFQVENGAIQRLLKANFDGAYE